MTIAYPARATVVEVLPRDGLQSLSRIYPAAVKARLVELLAGTGVPKIEVTSFAHPAKVPQHADAEEVFRLVRRRPGTVYRALVPNVRGAQRALAAGADELLAVMALSEAYNARNVGMTVDESVAEVLAVADAARAQGVHTVAALGLVLFCAYEGEVPRERVLRVAGALEAGGVEEIYLSTSTGVDSPRPLGDLLLALREAAPGLRLGVHLHEGNGQALACALAALDAGVEVLEGSACGVGGGIRMPGGMAYSGNLASEDLVAMLAACGVETGLDPEAYEAAAREAAALLELEHVPSRALAGATRAAVRASAGGA